jgi:uncharacterized protein YggU (UPF0235/DUF167 family)
MIGTPVSGGAWSGEVLQLQVRARPRARRLELGEVRGRRLLLRLTAAPADGAANEQARRLLARAFGVGVTRVRLASGARHADKVFHIMAPARLPAALMVSAAAAGL